MNSSKKWILFLAGCALAMSVPAQAQQADVAHAPRLVCAEPLYNFGERDSSEVVTHVFSLKNEGDLTLELTQVRPSCGCTVAHLSRNQVPPGETAEITAEFSLKGRSGQQRKNIRVENNDPTNQQFMLYLEGTIVTELMIEPSQLYLGQIGPDQLASQSVTITSKKELVITAVTSTVPVFVPELAVLETGKQYRVTVATKPPMEMGSQQGEIRLTREGGEEIVIPISAVILGPLSYAPKELVLRGDDPNLVTRYIIVRPGEVKNFEIKGVEIPDESIQGSVTTLGSSGYRIQVSNVRADQSLDGKKVIIRTSVPEMPVIEIPFKIIPLP